MLFRSVDPGAFIWLEEYNRQPMQSAQIFSEFMDEEMLNSALEVVDGTNFTTAMLFGTTIDNPSFSVKARQEVEVLLININTPIPTLIAGPEFIDTLKQPMGNMVIEIATNPVLLARVNAFLDLGDEVQGGEENEMEEKDIDITTSASVRRVPMDLFTSIVICGILSLLVYF